MTAIERKQAEVEALQAKINDSVATVVVNYSGLTVEQMTNLRSNLNDENVELKVIKNNISSRAFKAADMEMDDVFSGPTAVAFSSEDVTAAARILNDFAKDNSALELIGGTFDGEVASLEQVKELATLPNKEGMLSMLLSVLEAPVRGLAQVTNQIAEARDEE
ncbi:50S ribosomal protein L10 [Mollicutes bacterium LVI A0078]|nr:50S ribosomal protein L10 [Mollicutes bacterium LVI A0075]WOO91782.1 50S ribosomal protein L10 [Mollicutes bacterium LVI A0078]